MELPTEPSRTTPMGAAEKIAQLVDDMSDDQKQAALALLHATFVQKKIVVPFPDAFEALSAEQWQVLKDAPVQPSAALVAEFKQYKRK